MAGVKPRRLTPDREACEGMFGKGRASCAYQEGSLTSCCPKEAGASLTSKMLTDKNVPYGIFCTCVGSTAGPTLVAKSAPDGYTLLLNTSAQAYGAAILKNLPYDPLKDFIPVAALTSQPYVLVTGKLSGITTVGELIAAAKAKPGKLRFGSTGIGTGTHLGAEKFNLKAGIRATHVPAQAGEAIADTIANTVAGRTDYQLAPIQLALVEIVAGRLVALGVTTKKRSSLLPEVPTIAESGIPGFDWPIWYGVWVRAGTPAGVVDKVAKDLARVLASPDMRDWLANHGADPMIMTQPDFARFVLSESESAIRIIAAAGIKASERP